MAYLGGPLPGSYGLASLLFSSYTGLFCGALPSFPEGPSPASVLALQTGPHEVLLYT